MYRIGIIRSAADAISKNQYNIQEIGLAKVLAELGMCIDVFLFSDKGETYIERLGEEDRVTVYWLKGIKIPGRQGYYKDLKKILGSNHYDLIQALDDSQITTVWASQYCKKKGIKFVLWQGMYENYPEMYKRILQYAFDGTLLRILRKNTKYCIAKTTSAKKYLEMKHFNNISVIPVGLETGNFRQKECIDYRKKFGIPNQKKIMLYIGRVEERRKPIFCVDVYQEIKKRNDDCCLVYVGKGPMLQEIHDYVEIRQIKDVYFVDSIPQDELPDLYRCSSLFILPTRYEIFGMVIMEAMYFGTPVITYSAAGPLDVIENDADGLVIDYFDCKKWAETAYRHLFTLNDCEKMGIKAKEKIEREYLWSTVARRYAQRYISIINEK